jgi:hypothetical protein
MLRVLNGERRKFTVRVMHGDKIIEFQADKPPKLDWNTEARSLFIAQTFDTSGFSIAPIMKWEEGMIMLCEENPKLEGA